jgi:hypothetical protein
MAEAKNLLPGGVNSPVRAFKSVGGAPIVFDRVKGAYAFDVDGNKYIDYVGSWGPAICGHANDQARAAARCCTAWARQRASRCRWQFCDCGCSASAGLREGCLHDAAAAAASPAAALSASRAAQVNAALIKQLEKGTSFGAPCALEVRARACPALASAVPRTHNQRPNHQPVRVAHAPAPRCARFPPPRARTSWPRL